MSAKYGLFIGRFQPLHRGHQSIITEILHDGLHPVVMVGSSNKRNRLKNPLTYMQREKMLHTVFPTMLTVLPLPDYETDDGWIGHIKANFNAMMVSRNEVTLYIFEKAEDMTDGRHYTDCLREHFDTKRATYPNYLGHQPAATNIRKEKGRALVDVDPRIHHLLHEIWK